MNDPIFLLSSERSGSNLIRVMMDGHPHCAAPHSPHLVKTFIPILAHYGDLSVTANLKSLADDMLEVVRLQLRDWIILPTVQEVIDKREDDSFASLLASLYQLAAVQDDQTRTFIKDNGAIPHAAELAAQFPNSKFVYLVRDARDVALSWKKSPGHPGGVREAAKMWRMEQTAALRFLSLVAARDRVLIVHYEDLVSTPETALTKICQHVDLEFDSSMLQFFDGQEAKTSADAAIGWRNLTKPVMKGNFGKYRSELSMREQRIIESIVGPQLIQLGYELDHRPTRPWIDSSMWGKLWRASLTSARQIMRGRAGIEELRQRVTRLKGLQGITTRMSQETPKWSQPDSSSRRHEQP